MVAARAAYRLCATLAALKAVTPSTSDITFFRDSKGKADTVNAGFLREDSLLAVIVATDEEDCSASRPEDLFDTSSAVFVEPEPNLRCFRFKEEALYPVQRYVDGLLATRYSPDLFVFAGIVGIPVSNNGVEWAGQEFDAMLNHEQMREEVDPNSSPVTVRTSCDVDGLGKAYPPRRIVELAKGLAEAESNAVIQSICQSSYEGAIGVILDKIADVLGGACLPRDLTPNVEGIVNCDVIETLPEGKACTDVPGRVSVGAEDGHELCRVNQIAVPSAPADGVVRGEGWYYDNFTADVLERCQGEVSAQRIAFAEGSEPLSGTVVDLQCLQQINDTQVDAVRIGAQCANDAVRPETPAPATTFCDAQTNTYQYACNSDTQCDAAGLKGWRCWKERAGGASAICVNPTCSSL